MPGDATTIHEGERAEPAAARNYLLVIGDELTQTHALPVAGQVSIGRAADCDICIDHPSISRRHALLSVGRELSIEDLGSANGVRVQENLIAADRPAAVRFGEAFALGSVVLLVQKRTAPPAPARIRTHAYFEGRLEDECERGPGGRRRFAVARIHATAPGVVFEELVLASLRPDDIVAFYAPGEIVALLFDVDPAGARELTDQVAARLAQVGRDVRVGIACYPIDGQSPDALLDAAAHPLQGNAGLDGDEAGVVVRTPAVVQLYRTLDQVAAGRISVLLLGETGVGKEVVAKALHQASPRRAAPYVRLNCAALSPTLLESELFGYEKGAFTGAARAKPGLLETAEAGTVFLDEVGELPLDTQVKLLRVIEEREVLRVGGLEPRPIDVRFVAATNRDLEGAVARGTFRQDLFFRLNGITLVIPPLRERPEELLPIAEMFVRQASREIGTSPPLLSEPVRALMRSYGWPGNVRELRNMMERAVLLCGGGVIELAHLPVDKMRVGAVLAAAERPAAAAAAVVVAAPAAADPERARIMDALTRCGGSQTRAAELLGISRRTLTKRLTRYDLPRPRKDRKRAPS